MNGIPVDHSAAVGVPPRLDEAALRRPVTVLVVGDTPSVGEASVARVPHVAHSSRGEASVASAAGEASVASAAGEASVASAAGEASVARGACVVASLHVEGVPGVVIVIVVV